MLQLSVVVSFAHVPAAFRPSLGHCSLSPPSLKPFMRVLFLPGLTWAEEQNEIQAECRSHACIANAWYLKGNLENATRSHAQHLTLSTMGALIALRLNRIRYQRRSRKRRWSRRWQCTSPALLVQLSALCDVSSHLGGSEPLCILPLIPRIGLSLSLPVSRPTGTTKSPSIWLRAVSVVMPDGVMTTTS